MLILAVETSCDETAAAVVRDGREALSNVVGSQAEMHAMYGGVVPEVASRQHLECITGIVRAALDEAGAGLRDMDAVAVTCAPGLIGALLVGVNFAKAVAFAQNAPLIPVHHMRGHIAANYLSFPELEPPFTALLASGGHTLIVDVQSYTKMEAVGGTRDDAAGEAFDKAARALGLGYPGGAMLDKLSEGGDPAKYQMPRPKLDGAELDMSFSGLKTAALNIINRAAMKNEELDRASFAASFCGAVSDVLTPRVMLAARNMGYGKIAVAGGVAANRAVRGALEDACRSENVKLYVPPISLCGDNAAMIGSQAYYEYLDGRTAGMELNAFANMDISANF